MADEVKKTSPWVKFGRQLTDNAAEAKAHAAEYANEEGRPANQYELDQKESQAERLRRTQKGFLGK
jgi:hypothetical protein